jgi:phosphoglycerate dehydrogenase-like enzyme
MRLIVSEAIAETMSRRVTDEGLPVDLIVVDRDGRPVTHGGASTTHGGVSMTHAAIDEADALLLRGLSDAGFAEVLRVASRLRWVHASSAGVEHLLDLDLGRRDLLVTNSAGVYAIPIAEWVLFALLSIVKRGPELLAMQRERRWHGAPELDELGGKTLTILGAGGIGVEIAKRAAAFDMRVWGINRSGRPLPHVERVISGDDWRDALAETDFLVIATPLTPATRGMIGARELDSLPDRAWLINVARGAIVDEPALIDALREQRIGGAALDVFETEPLPPASPLWSLPNVLIWPHHSGSSPRADDRMLDLFIQNVSRFVRGEELLNVVDLDAGY